MTTVYLAGPIYGLSYAGATNWRDYATEYLSRYGIRGVSPMRAKDYLRSVDLIDAESHGKAAGDSPFGTYQSILTRDRFDCTRADLVLINLLGAKRVSIGTMMEVAWADLARVPAVLVMEPGNVHEHGMVTAACGFRVPDLESGLEVVASILKGSAVDR